MSSEERKIQYTKIVLGVLAIALIVRVWYLLEIIANKL